MNAIKLLTAPTLLAAMLACGGPAGTMAESPTEGEDKAEPAKTAKTKPVKTKVAKDGDAKTAKAAKPKPGKKPDIFLVIWDTTRPDRLTPYGAERPTTPFLNNLAKQGAVFENAFATSYWTLPSLAGLFTGLYTHNHKVSYDVEDYTLALAKGATPMAAALKKEGYATAIYAVAGILNKRGQFLTGFDDSKVGGPAKIVPWTMNFIDEHEDQPRFIVLYYRDPHAPYRPGDKHDIWNNDKLPDAYLGIADHEVADKTDEGWLLIHDVATGKKKLKPGQWTQLKAHYDGELHLNDTFLKAFWKGLQKRELAEDSFLAFTSDHGEAFNEHAAWPVGHRHPHEEVLRVPLIIRYPALFPAETRVATSVRNFDLYPTILDVAGATPDHKINARTLVETLSKPNANREVMGFGHTYCAPQFYRDAKFKIVSCRRGEEKWELFDLVNDPDEKKNLATEKPGLLQAYKKKMAKRVEATALDIIKKPAKKAGDAEKKALEAIGYME